MVHRALFRNSLFFLIAFVSCKEATKPVVIPDVYVLKSDIGLQQRTGYLYYNGKKFSGRTYELYPNGDTALLFSYLNGKEEGWCRQWYNGKKLMEQRFYSAGKKEGQHKGWWEDGTPKYEYHFAKGEHDGEAKEWFSNGQLFKALHYTKGYEEGSQKWWWEDGSVRANYVVKDGEQYGLIGRKLCINNDSAKIH